MSAIDDPRFDTTEAEVGTNTETMSMDLNFAGRAPWQEPRDDCWKLRKRLVEWWPIITVHLHVVIKFYILKKTILSSAKRTAGIECVTIFSIWFAMEKNMKVKQDTRKEV